MTVKAAYVDHVRDCGNIPGAIEIRVFNADDKVAGFAFICPCGCGQEGWLPVNREAGQGWQWDGNREAPTLTPSVRQLNGCKWHGYLTAGEWIPC